MQIEIGNSFEFELGRGGLFVRLGNWELWTEINNPTTSTISPAIEFARSNENALTLYLWRLEVLVSRRREQVEATLEV